MSRIITRREKLIEKIPSLVVLLVIISPVLGALTAPVFTAYAVIIFNVYFLYKSISYFILVALAVIKIRTTEGIDWMKKIVDLHNPEAGIERLKQELVDVQNTTFESQKEKLHKNKRIPKFLDRYAFIIEKRKTERFINKEIENLEILREQGIHNDTRDLHHIIMVPHWKEPYEVLADTVRAISASTFPTKQITVLMAAEARDEEGIQKSYRLKEEFGDNFENFWVSSHVMQDDEIIGKSSNMAWAGKFAVEKIKELGWDMKKTTMTSCDADSLIHKQHFAKLSYEYSLREDAHYKFYTGAIIFYSNIWRLKFYARVKNSISSLYNMTGQLRPDKLVPFSTYTASFWLIDQIGYWTPWITPEDFHIFFKSLFKFPNKVSTVPLFLKTMSDAAEGSTHTETIKNNYFQQRRWIWGVTIDGWMLSQVIKLTLKGKITLRAAYVALHVFFDHIVGVVVTFILVLGGNLPYLINPQFAGTVLGSRLPTVSGFIIQITVWFLIGLILTDYYFVKPKSDRKGFLKTILTLLEWVFLPYITFFIVFLPGIEAHTRLLFGKRLEYYLTKKK